MCWTVDQSDTFVQYNRLHTELHIGLLCKTWQQSLVLACSAAMRHCCLLPYMGQCLRLLAGTVLDAPAAAVYSLKQDGQVVGVAIHSEAA